MIQNLNPVRPKIRLDGEEISFESMILEQEMNTCHRFEVIKEFMSQDELWQESSQNWSAKIGCNLLISLEHLDSTSSYEFSGIVMDVQVEAWEPTVQLGNRRVNRIHIIGSGDVVVLDGAKGRSSYVDCQLEDVVLQLTEGSGIEVDCEPQFKGVLPYLMRYDESVFSFLNRLSSIFGEHFYYDGKAIHFGKSNEEQVESLVYERDMLSLRTQARAMPYQTSYYDYYLEDDQFVVRSSSFQSVGLLGDLAKKSDSIFQEKGVAMSESSLLSSTSLDDYVVAQQNATVGRMFNVEAETRTCRIRLGGIVEIAFPIKMGIPSLGRFRIVALSHRIDKNGNYSNRFIASPEELVSVPRFNKVVKAYPELAVVSDNADPMNLGRVKVQFDWQKPKWQTTNWIRVVTPNGGEGGPFPTNRGWVFIPEIGDQVMVGFEHGDPNRPYVMGCLFGGGTASGGGSDNSIKSIRTRGGHQILFNDDENGELGITISDKNGNTIQLDTSGLNITISSQNSISLISSNISIDAGESLTISAGKSMILNAEENLKMLSGENSEISANSVQIDAVEEVICRSDSLSVEAKSGIDMNSKKIEIDSTEDNLLLATGGDVDVQSKGKVNLF